MVLLLVFMQLTRDLFAIAKFLFYQENAKNTSLHTVHPLISFCIAARQLSVASYPHYGLIIAAAKVTFVSSYDKTNVHTGVKMQDRNMRTKFQGWKMQDKLKEWKMQDRKMRDCEIQDWKMKDL